MNTEEPQYFLETQVFYQWVPISLGESAVFYRDAPPNFQVLPAAQVKRSKTSGAGASGRADIQGRKDSNWLESSWEAVIRSASEGSLSLTVAFSLKA